MNMHAPAGTSLIADLRPEARNAPESGIVEVVNHGRLKPGLIPLWVGEGDLATPEFIVRAANKSLADGETFYTGSAAFRTCARRWRATTPRSMAAPSPWTASTSPAPACSRSRSRCG